MGQDAVPEVDFPKLALHTHSSQGCASSSQASHDASSLVDLTSQEMLDSMTCFHLRMDSQDTQFHEIQGQLSNIISWIHSQGALSSTPHRDAQLYMFLCIYFNMDFFCYCISYASRMIFLLYIYIYIYFYFICFVIFYDKKGEIIDHFLTHLNSESILVES